MDKSFTRISRWCFILGLIIALAAGFSNLSTTPIILFLIGLVVGLLNFSIKNSSSFLIGIIALLLIGMSGLQSISILSSQFTQMAILAIAILRNFVAFVAAVGIIIALKQVIALPRVGSREE